MRALVPLLVTLALAGCAGHGSRPPGSADDPWGPYISEASHRHNVPEKWVRAVMLQESAGRPDAVSKAGAIGLMQLMPATYDELRTQYGLGRDPKDPHDNIMAGTGYMRQMYERFGAPGFLAAYNAGPRRMESYLYRRGSLPNETINYVSVIAPQIADTAPMTGPLAVFARADPPTRGPTRYAAASPRPAPRGPLPACDADLAWDPAHPCRPVQPPAEPIQVAQAPAQAPVHYSALDGAPATPMITPSAPFGATQGGWAVQVGAFTSVVQARQTAETARRNVADLLAAAAIQTPPTAPFGGHVLYRARLSGLSQDAAERSCARLDGVLPCVKVPPGGA